MIDVEGILHDWGERWDWSYSNPNKGKLIGSAGSIQFRFNTLSGGSRTVRGALNSIVRKTPQAVVKITGGGRGMKAMAIHLKYISRDGDVELVDEQGISARGLDEVEDLARSMEHGGGDVVPPVSQQREAFNVVFSMPPGTDRFQFKTAANAFIKAEFEGCQYAVAHHDDEAHPHCHVMIKAVKLDGKRLNPRKADIANWRANFATALRAHGIDADATPRQVRLSRAAGVSQAKRHEKAQAVGTQKVKEGTAAATRRAQLKAKQGRAIDTRRRAVRDLWAVHAALKTTNRGGDMALAREISTMLRKKGYQYDYAHERAKALAAGLDRGPQTSRAGPDRMRDLQARDVAPSTRPREAGRLLQGDASRDVQR